MSVTIGNNVTTIGDFAFMNCTSLEKIYFNATAMDDLIGGRVNGELQNNGVFYSAGVNGNGIEVVVGKNVTKIPANLFNPYNGLSYSPKITSVEFEEDGLCNSIGKLAFYYCYTITTVVIPESITSIGDQAFYECKNLIEVYNLSALKITVGSSANGYVGRYAISVYTSLDIPSKQWKTEDGFLFYEDGNTCYLLGHNIGDKTEITLPESCNGKSYEIYKRTFENNYKVTKITISNSVTSIGYQAFRFCSKLETIYYKGTAEEWADISIGEDNTYLTGATVYFYSEEAPADEGSFWHYGNDGEIVVW